MLNKKSPELPIKDFYCIKSIFDKKKWPILDDDSDDDSDDNIFNNFCSMLAGLENDERELILSLTEKFLWVQDTNYIKYFIRVFDKFIANYEFINGNKILLCPLLTEEDFGKSKSSTFLFYWIKSALKAKHKKYMDFHIKYVDLPSSVDIKDIDSGYILCLVDDFIGTGETVEHAIKYFLDKQFDKNRIVIVSLVGMNFGISALEDQGYKVYVDVSCEKGLVGYDENKIQLMRKIEAKIKVKPRFNFGYKNSEALVKMVHTPNNTFPIYWLRNENNEFAPFPR